MKPVALETKNRDNHLYVLGLETVNHGKEIWKENTMLFKAKEENQGS